MKHHLGFASLNIASRISPMEACANNSEMSGWNFGRRMRLILSESSNSGGYESGRATQIEIAVRGMLTLLGLYPTRAYPNGTARR